MGAIIGYDFWGLEVFDDDSSPLQNVKYGEFGNVVIDEISIREQVNNAEDETTYPVNTKTNWKNDTLLLGKFVNSLEAGNIDNSGVRIVKFRVMRRDNLDDKEYYLGDIELNETDTLLEFADSTQPNGNITYSIIPVGENGLDGTPREIDLTGDNLFTGWWIVDKDANDALPFDKAIGSIGTVDIGFNESRITIDTFSEFQQVYYMPQNYHSFTLNSVFLPEEWQRSGETYKRILNDFIKLRKPLFVKSDSGLAFVVNLFNLRVSLPQNTWKGYDYVTVSVDAVEIGDITSYMEGEL